MAGRCWLCISAAANAGRQAGGRAVIGGVDDDDLMDRAFYRL